MFHFVYNPFSISHSCGENEAAGDYTEGVSVLAKLVVEESEEIRGEGEEKDM